MVHFFTGEELRAVTGSERSDNGTWTLHASAPVGAQNDSVIKEKDAFLIFC